jgi:hypothetical protein
MRHASDDPFAKLDEFLGAPTLMKGDDPDQYLALQKAVGQLMKPRDLFETLEAHDLVDAIADSARFKAHAVELVNLEWDKALKKMATLNYVSRAAAKAIAAYLAGPKNGTAESTLLKKIGLSRLQVEAHAVLLAGEEFLAIDKLASNRTATRNALLKASRKTLAAKRKKLAAKKKRLAAREKRLALRKKERAAAKDAWLEPGEKPRKSGSDWD